MPNKTYALEWLDLAKKNLETAKLLFREDHYTDIIAIEIHQTIEKVMKSIIAYNGAKIPKTHDLMNLYEKCESYTSVTKETTIDELIIINDYYETERYPGPRYFIPAKSEIEKNLSVADKLYNKAYKYINE